MATNLPLMSGQSSHFSLPSYLTNLQSVLTDCDILFQAADKYTVEPVYNGHPWDHAKWLLYRGGLLIEVGGALGLY